MKTYLLKSAPAVEPKAAPKTARPRLPNLPDPPDEAVRDLLRACHQVVPLRHNLRSAGTTASAGLQQPLAGLENQVADHVTAGHGSDRSADKILPREHRWFA